jgi:hypothetical protein
MRVFLALARLLCLLMYLALTKNITLCIPIIFLGSFVLRLNTHSILVSVGNWQDGATAVCVWILGQMVSKQYLENICITVPHDNVLDLGISFVL